MTVETAAVTVETGETVVTLATVETAVTVETVQTVVTAGRNSGDIIE